jgi:hypothetical protein
MSLLSMFRPTKHRLWWTAAMVLLWICFGVAMQSMLRCNMPGTSGYEFCHFVHPIFLVFGSIYAFFQLPLLFSFLFIHGIGNGMIVHGILLLILILWIYFLVCCSQQCALEIRKDEAERKKNRKK